MGDLTISEFVCKALNEHRKDFVLLLHAETCNVRHERFLVTVRQYHYPGKGGEFVFVTMTFKDRKHILNHLGHGFIATRHYDTVMRFAATEIDFRIGDLK